MEVYYSGIWGTVCDDYWGKHDADVACRMLGYSHAVKATTKGLFGFGTGPILLDDVQCDGNDISLATCNHKDWLANNCDHDEDAGVVCFTNKSGTHVQYNFNVVLLFNSFARVSF